MGNLSHLTINKISNNTIPNLDRDNITLETVQEIENAYLNNEMVEKFCLNGLIIGVQGDVEDFMIFLNYLSKPDGSLFPGTEQDINELRNLANSFRPKRRVNLKQIHKCFAEDGRFTKKDYGDWLQKVEEPELARALARLAQLNQSKVYLFWKKK